MRSINKDQEYPIINVLMWSMSAIMWFGIFTQFSFLGGLRDLLIDGFHNAIWPGDFWR